MGKFTRDRGPGIVRKTYRVQDGVVSMHVVKGREIYFIAENIDRLEASRHVAVGQSSTIKTNARTNRWTQICRGSRVVPEVSLQRRS